MCPVQDLSLVMAKVNRVRQKHWIWTETLQILKVGDPQVFVLKNQCGWVEMFAQRGRAKGEQLSEPRACLH